jgi:1-aminocyclopropane-1-carboxylate deaminase
LKGATFLERDINATLQQINNTTKINWEINLDYHFGGFARSNKELLAFMECFTRNHAMALDSVYTGKMFYGIYDLIKQGKIHPGQRILAIHTGGLQGMRETG